MTHPYPYIDNGVLGGDSQWHGQSQTNQYDISNMQDEGRMQDGLTVYSACLPKNLCQFKSGPVEVLFEE